MTPPDSATRTVLELWPRRREPDSHDLVRALRAANHFEAEPSSPFRLRALAFRLVSDLYEAAGWNLLQDAHLPLCQAASDAARVTSATVVEATLGTLDALDGPALVAGTLGAARSTFGEWDLLPDPSAELILLSDVSGTTPPTRPAVRRTDAGPLASVLRTHAEPAKLSGRAVLIPSPELAAALLAPRAESAAELPGLIFCAGAHRAVVNQTWSEVLSLTAELGLGHSAEAAVVRLGLQEWLDLPLTRRARLANTLHRLVWR